ncbi:DUF6090 family protein [Eudoraea adriatica]|uniref:DUF6090 family protein n=1 Tax=Eudoraea adriatica TaxID=446681 RepID=UPI00037EA0B1|nr:DUF6090 family protein [Eudoraea adriatica]
MINFFRRIRRNLADDNKPLKYMRYAIGEILLVVIGILIALQINNWNEERKDAQKGIKVLEELANNIEYNIENIEKYIRKAERFNEYSDYVIKVLERDIPYSDSLDNVLNSALLNLDDFHFSDVAYESLKNMGSDYIQDDVLKNEIVKLFDESFPEMLKMFSWSSTSAEIEYIDRNFFPVSGNNNLILKPYDFDVQMNDTYFLSMIHKRKIQRNFFNTRMRVVLEESQIVLQLIKEKLQNQ